MSRRKKISEKEVCDGLRRLAFGEITDAVSLLFEPEEKILQKLNTLDLFNVSEIKRQREAEWRLNLTGLRLLTKSEKW